MSKCLGANIGCKDKTSSWDLIGFPNNGSSIGSKVKYRGQDYRYTVHLHQTPCRDTETEAKVQAGSGYTVTRLCYIGYGTIS